MEFRFFEIYRNADYLRLLGEGMVTSLSISIIGGMIGFAMATVLAVLRYWKIPIFGPLAAIYVEFIRNTPLIVQLFFVTFGLPLLFGYKWPFWAHASLALVLNFSAYFSEILRAGFATIPSGQGEAAAALGLTRPVAFLKITFPQAVAAMYSSLNGQFIFLFLTTGVVSEIGVVDLTYAGVYIDSRTFRSFEVFITLTVLYIFLGIGLKSILSVLHDRLFKWRTVR